MSGIYVKFLLKSDSINFCFRSRNFSILTLCTNQFFIFTKIFLIFIEFYGRITVMSRVGFGMEFFGIRNAESRSRGFGIGIFCFGLDRKILGFYGFRTIGIFSGYSENPRDSGFFFRVSGCLSPGSGFFLISGFSRNPQDFHPRDSGFFTFGIGIFLVGWDIPTKSQLWL